MITDDFIKREILVRYYMDHPCLSNEIDYSCDLVRYKHYVNIVGGMMLNDVENELRELKDEE